MTQQIKDAFLQAFPIVITPAKAQALIKLVNAFELRDQNPLAFNHYSLGIYKCAFKTKDRDDFFNIFGFNEQDADDAVGDFISNGETVAGVDMKDIDKQMSKVDTQATKDMKTAGISAGDVRKTIQDISAIDNRFHVVSDPFNLFVPYVLFHLRNSKLATQLKEMAMFKTLMFLQYRFFTSIVNYRFPYKPDAAVMDAMFENLTNKFDIKQQGTWANVMKARAINILSANSVHANTLTTFTGDKEILYFVTDVQTRIRNQINLIAAEFYKTKEEHDRIETYSSVGTDEEGEKVLIDNNACFDMLVENVYTDSLSVAKFLDDRAIRLIISMFTNLNTTNFRSFLVNFSDKAVRDQRAQASDKEMDKDGKVLFVGAHILITNIVQKSYRFCLQNRVDICKPILILKTMKDAFASSRISDETILQLRYSTEYLVSTIQNSRRESVVSALRIGFMLYIILLSFKYLK